MRQKLQVQPLNLWLCVRTNQFHAHLLYAVMVVKGEMAPALGFVRNSLAKRVLDSWGLGEVTTYHSYYLLGHYGDI